MNWQRNIILASIGVVAWTLMLRWSDFQDQRDLLIEQSQPEVNIEIPQLNPTDTFAASPTPQTSAFPQVADEVKKVSVTDSANRELITVTTDVLNVVIDPFGGDIVEVKLLQHLTKMAEDGGQPITLLQRTSRAEYVALSGLIGGNATDKSPSDRPLFKSSAYEYSLSENEDSLNVDLVYNQEGAVITKRFEFAPNSYLIGVRYIIDNYSSEPWSSKFYGQIRRDSQPPNIGTAGGMQMQPFLGAAFREEDKNYSKHSFSDLEDEQVSSSIKGGWVAFVQHYFISAWVPPQDEKASYTLREYRDDIFLFEFQGKWINAAPGSVVDYKADFYVGPKDQPVLADLADYLDLTVDYGFLWMVAKPIFFVMNLINEVIGNWGWSIILLTILIKILLYPLSAAGLKSMAKMRKLHPEMTRIKEMYADDRQRASQEQMALFKKHKVNPAGGCFPMLLQMPVFIALFWVLSESVEIRHSPWIGWIQDLSTKDPLFILPLVMGASMFVMQKLQPAPTDPMQQKIFQIMPIAFTIFCLWFPAGLVLYWTVNNLLSMLQQWVINRQTVQAKS
jgi:YidC/Oxa1 family membrane protein insertase